MIATAIFVIACVGVIEGAVWMLRSELSKRRMRKMEWPPLRTLEISDSIPF